MKLITRLLLCFALLCGVFLLNVSPVNALLGNSLRAYYDLDTGFATTNNYSGIYGFANGTNVAITSYNTTLGKIGNATVIHGDSKGYVQITGADKTPWQSLPRSNFTLSQWIIYNSSLDAHYADSPHIIFNLFESQSGSPYGYFALEAYPYYGTGVQLSTWDGSTERMVKANGGYNVFDGNWHQIILTSNSQGTLLNYSLFIDGTYLNETNVYGMNTAMSVAGREVLIGGTQGSSSSYGGWTGAIDQVILFNKTLSGTEISELYNSGNGQSFDYISGTYFMSNLTSYNTIKINDDFNILLNCTYSGSKTYSITTNSSYLTCSNEVTTANSSVLTCQNTGINYGSYRVNSSCTNGVITGTQNVTLNFDNTRALVTVKNKDSFATLTPVVTSIPGISYITNNSLVHLWGTGTKTISFSSVGYNTTEQEIVFNSSQQNFTVYVSEGNHVLIRVYDIDGNNVTNATIQFVRTGNSQINYTKTTNYFYDVITPANYTITVNQLNFADSVYYAELQNNSYLELEAYLVPIDEAYTRTFYVKSAADYSTISDATLSFLAYVGAQQKTITQRKTDLTGSGTALLDPTREYLLRVNHPSYLAKEVTFTPTESAYTIYLGDSYEPDHTTIYTDVSYDITKPNGILQQNETYTFGLSISSGGGQLEYWGVVTNIGGAITTYNETGQPSGGIYSVNKLIPYNSTAQIQVSARYFFKTNDNTDEWSYTFNSVAYPTFSGNITLRSGLTNFLNQTSGGSSEEDMNKGSLSSFIIMGFAILGLLGLAASLGIASNPVFITCLAALIMGMFTLLGFFPIWLTGLISIPSIGIAVLNEMRG